MKAYQLSIKIKKEKGGRYLAYCPIWTDCYAQADTPEEAVQELYSVATSLIEVYREEGMEVPLKERDAKKSSQGNREASLLVYA